MAETPQKAATGSADTTIEWLLHKRAAAQGIDSAFDLAVLTIAGATRFLTATHGRSKAREAIGDIADVLDALSDFTTIERTGLRQ